MNSDLRIPVSGAASNPPVFQSSSANATALPASREPDSAAIYVKSSSSMKSSDLQTSGGGLALNPPCPSGLPAASKVDRSCSPFRYSDLSPLKTQPPTDTWTLWNTLSPSTRRCSFASTFGSDLKTVEYRPINSRAPWNELWTPTPITSFRSAADYRRDAEMRQRRLQVIQSMGWNGSVTKTTESSNNGKGKKAKVKA